MAEKEAQTKIVFPLANPDLTVAQLKETHELHKAFKSEWEFLYAAYEGTRELIALGYLLKHERETTENFNNRKKQAYGFGYSGSIVDTLNFYLNKKPPKRDLPSKVAEDKLYEMFSEDCNLEADDLDSFMTEQSRLASIMGYVGILVDKASVELTDRQEQIDNEVYPYLSSFFPQAILDWIIERNEYGRPTLTYLKLLQDDGKYLLWFQDHFEVWEIPLDKDGSEKPDTEKATPLVSSGHDLGEIPFVFIVNKKWRIRPIGKSDIPNVARIDVSIIRNLSQAEEVVDYSAFPMMRKAQLEGRPDGSIDKTDDVGVTAVLGFDPDNPDSKPDWLNSEAKDPIEAIIELIKLKVAEIYRSSNIGGMAATEISTVAKSGAALQTEFQMLNSSLVRKAIGLEKAEHRLHYFYYRWEYGEEAKKLLEETKIERDRTYDVENLAIDLENIITSKTIVISKAFNEAMQKKTARMMLPNWTESKLADIDSEIEESVEEEANKPKPGDPDYYDPFDERTPGDDPDNPQSGTKVFPFQKKEANAEKE
jgi:hypothetical protein